MQTNMRLSSVHTPQFGANVRPQDVQHVLEMLSCRAVRQKGSHLMMQTPHGKTLPPIPEHARDVSDGVIRSIANALGVPKNTLEDWIHHPKALKKALRQGELNLSI